MKERLEEAQRAFATLDEIAHVERPSALQRDAALVMTDNRNLLVHTYKEALAVEVFSHLGAHATVLRAWLDAIRIRVEKI